MLRKASGRQVKIPANVHKQAHRAVAPRKARQSTPDVTVDGMKPAPNGREEVATRRVACEAECHAPSNLLIPPTVGGPAELVLNWWRDLKGNSEDNP